MDTLLDRHWTAESFLAWEDRQKGKHEFDGVHVFPMTGGSYAHQDMVFNLRGLLARLLMGQPYRVGAEMRLRIGNRFRYSDVSVSATPQDQTTKAITDAVAIFEVLSDDTAMTDRIVKLREYADIPSLRTYVLLEQTCIGALIHRRGPGQSWTVAPVTEGTLDLPELGITVPLADIYQGLTFPS